MARFDIGDVLLEEEPYVGDKLGVDTAKLIDTRFLCCANSGGGKSWMLRLIAERIGIQTIILDHEGEFATLREKLDILLVGDRGDLVTDVRTAGLLARRLMEHRTSAVIDLQDLPLASATKPTRRKYVRLFLEALIALPRNLWHPVLIVIDEAHLYCPERGFGEAESTDAVIALMSQGRKRGFCGGLATQRISKLHKDAAAEANNYFIGRTTLDADQKRSGDILGMDKADRMSLRLLGEGEWFAFGPSLRTKGIIHFQSDQVETTHPKAGKRHLLKAPKPSSAIKSVLARLTDLPKEAETEARTIGQLQTEVNKLKHDLKTTQSELLSARKPFQITETVVDQKAIDLAVNLALDAANKFWSAQYYELRNKAGELSAPINAIIRMNPEWYKPQRPKVKALSKPSKETASLADPIKTELVKLKGTRPPTSRVPLPVNGDGKLSPGAQAILAAAVKWEIGRTAGQLAILSGRSKRSSAFYPAIRELQTAGYLTGVDVGGLLKPTVKALAEAGEAAFPLKGQALIDHWTNKLPVYPRRIFEVLTKGEVYQEESLAAEVGYSLKSSAWRPALRDLEALGLIHVDDSDGAIHLADLY